VLFVTGILAVVAPPGFQEYPTIELPPEAVAVAFNVVEVLVQVITPAGLQETEGLELFSANVVDAEAVQPLPDCVTVTV
jgi:hypothetical protein